MTKHDEIQSTEKLLDLIRNQDQIDDAPSSGKREGEPPTKSPGRKFGSAAGLRKKIVVGVDIGHSYIKLAKIRHNSGKTYQLLDYLNVPLNKSANLKDPAILSLLKTTLNQFCGGESNIPIWAAITSANVETRCLHIPKLTAKQVQNAVFWTFTKKVPLNAGEELLDYEILGDVSEGGVKKTEIMAFKAPKEEIETLKTAFQSIGFPLAGITIVPFAIQNLFRAQLLESDGQDICCLFVGRDWSRIAIYSNRNLVLSRGIKAGMRSMIEAINSALTQKKQPNGSFSDAIDLSKNNGPRSATIDPASQKLFFDFLVHPATSEPSELLMGYSPVNVFQMLMPAMERLIRQIERTFEHYNLNFHNEGIKKIYISGSVTSNQMIIDHIGSQLDLPIVVMDPFSAPGSFTEMVKVPNGAADKEGFVPAIGLALSNNRRTPNFLYTHQDKENAERVRNNNTRVLTACLIFLIFLIAVFSWQERRVDQKRIEVAKLNDKLLSFTPPAERDIVLALYAQTKNKRQAMKQMAARYAPVSMITELSKLTPPHIRLLSMDASFTPPSGTEAGTIAGTLVLEGIVFSNEESFETLLTSYLFGLKGSPIFEKPQLINKRTIYYNGKEVLRFDAKLELI